MKYSYFHLLTALAFSAAPFYTEAEQPAQQSKVMNMREVTSNNALSQRLRMAQQKDPIRDLGPPKGNLEVDPAKKTASRDLIKSSTIISYNGLLTLVPKKSVLFTPEKLSDRIGEKPNVKVKNFQEFFSANRGWIRTIEVSRDQALGHVPFSEAIIKSIGESNSIVIATYQGGPISVLPQKTEEEIPSRLDMKPVIYRK
ncbi:MAG: hypothetical protein P1U86_13415 [Verrucomicrobiales bacterium]|nr:hypothetical protein [Verrucomicrobiales bacterium]